ncbi:MAG: hypothetical protein AAB783_01765 [Patescibacteria group bacterium]
MLERLMSSLKYLNWKFHAHQAIRMHQTRDCLHCSDPVVPEDLVGEHREPGGVVKLFHAGTHYSLNAKAAYCAPETMAVGRWDGQRVVYHDALVSRREK